MIDEFRAKAGVVFDMDGVLVDSAEQHFESWRQLAREIGKPVTREQFDRTFGMQNRDIIPAVFGETDAEKVRRWSLRKEALYRDLIREHPPIIDGSVDLVRGLAERGVRLAVGSSAPRANVELVLSLMGVAGLFVGIVSGDEVERGKPDPEVYAKAVTMLGLSPAECVVIEDAPVGVAAAVAAGTRAVAILIHHPASAFEQADLHFHRLADVGADDILQLVAGDR